MADPNLIYYRLYSKMDLDDDTKTWSNMFKSTPTAGSRNISTGTGTGTEAVVAAVATGSVSSPNTVKDLDLDWNQEAKTKQQKKELLLLVASDTARAVDLESPTLTPRSRQDGNGYGGGDSAQDDIPLPRMVKQPPSVSPLPTQLPNSNSRELELRNRILAAGGGDGAGGSGRYPNLDSNMYDVNRDSSYAYPGNNRTGITAASARGRVSDGRIAMGMGIGEGRTRNAAIYGYGYDTTKLENIAPGRYRYRKNRNGFSATGVNMKGKNGGLRSTSITTEAGNINATDVRVNIAAASTVTNSGRVNVSNSDRASGTATGARHVGVGPGARNSLSRPRMDEYDTGSGFGGDGCGTSRVENRERNRDVLPSYGTPEYRVREQRKEEEPPPDPELSPRPSTFPVPKLGSIVGQYPPQAGHAKPAASVSTTRLVPPALQGPAPVTTQEFKVMPPSVVPSVLSPIQTDRPIVPEPGPSSTRKKLRIVCISDTHNNCPQNLPPGDILLHAGDLTNQGSYTELLRAVTWLKNLKGRYEYKVVIPGNHDLCLDREWVEDFGGYLGKEARDVVGVVEGEEERDEGWRGRLWEKCVGLFTDEEAMREGIVYLGPTGNCEVGLKAATIEGTEASAAAPAAPAPTVVTGKGISARTTSIKKSIKFLQNSPTKETLNTISALSSPPSPASTSPNPKGKLRTLTLRDRTTVTVWGCPYVPRILWKGGQMEGVGNAGGESSNGKHLSGKPREWAFGYDPPSTLQESIWSELLPYQLHSQQSATNIDILLTHTPPKYHLDENSPSSSSSTSSTTSPPFPSNISPTITSSPPHHPQSSHFGTKTKTNLSPPIFLGCEFLRQALSLVRPQVHVFGHVHQGWGVEKVRWDTRKGWLKFREEGVVEFGVAGGGRGEGKKMTVVDLSGKRHANTRNKGAQVSLGTIEESGSGGGGGGGGSSALGGDKGEGKDNPWAKPLEIGQETCLVNASYMLGSYHARRLRGKTPVAGERLSNKAVVVDMEIRGGV